MWKVKRMKPARIVVLLIALAAGGIAALLAGRSDRPAQIVQAPVASLETVDVLIAGSDIGLGHTISGNELRWQTWPTAAAGAHFIRRKDRPDAINQLAGSIARSPFMTGEPIREARLIKAQGSGYMAAILPSGMRAVSTDVTPETGAAGFILPNDRVDVILSRRDREGGAEVHISETILSNVRVLAIDQTVEEKGGQRVVVGKTATLELSQR
jgi:pilus assembly protein CpaB